jgi:hypothetical protein
LHFVIESLFKPLVAEVIFAIGKLNINAHREIAAMLESRSYAGLMH